MNLHSELMLQYNYLLFTRIFVILYDVAVRDVGYLLEDRN